MVEDKDWTHKRPVVQPWAMRGSSGAARSDEAAGPLPGHPGESWGALSCFDGRWTSDRLTVAIIKLAFDNLDLMAE